MPKMHTSLKRMLPRSLVRKLLLVKYRGSAYACPCCHYQARQFWPSGVNQKPNTLCPSCGSLERHRLLWLFFQRHPELLRRSQRILHVAPERQIEQLLRSIPEVKYLSAGLESPPAEVCMDLTNTGMQDKSFDGIVCCHVLEHIPNDGAALRELYRILAPGGWAILQVPVDYARQTTYEDPNIISPGDRLREFGQEDHVRVYGRDYEDRLRNAGFRVDVHWLQETLGADQIDYYRLDPEERIFLCWKTAEGERLNRP
ncbi:MAG: type 11 methyltransferase [Armatimonadota bacterium]|nr:MAG: type 11 methyltransferase [Armatimonadota bacterium]